MINNNKILTVSYGTFSCTLEGFDDSFGTMKAIAEYFRDLSADDRYFGAEPSQPDAQMLARIAEREISRHVEAREDKGRIVLSAQTVEKAPVDTVEDATMSKHEEADAPSQDDIVEVETTSDVDADAQESAEPSHAALPAEQTTEIADTYEMAAAEQDIVPSLPDAQVEAFFADAAPADMQEPAAQEEPAQDRANASSIADKLKRIRAVVSQQSDAVAAPNYTEDEHAEGGAAQDQAVAEPVEDAAEDTYAEDLSVSETAIVEIEEETLGESDHDDGLETAQQDVLADTLRDLEDALDADDEFDTSDAVDTYDEEEIALEEEVSLEDEEDDIAAILNRLAEEDAPSKAPVIAENEAIDDRPLAAMDSLVAAPSDEDLEQFDDENFFEEEVAEVVQKAEPAPVAPPAPAAPRARVLKVKRATLEAAIAAGKLEEYSDDADGAGQTEAKSPPAAPVQKAPVPQSSTLSAAAEDDLARELAALEADMKADDAEPDAKAIEAEEVMQPLAAAARAKRPSADDDFSRLMQETDSQMDEPEGATRRDAFAHLRAAVAAKKADDAVGDGKEEGDSNEAYRDDLANVVRQQRPTTAAEPAAEGPVEQPSAPLKLVAEQRIDVEEVREEAPARPRRVAAVPTRQLAPEPDEMVGFAAFAAQAGAKTLPDVLEAAAAYLAFVEGHEQFSRPQLMTIVRQVEKENFTREDSLRSFGKLLREGKIEKLKGGRFQASDQIGFKPDARAAG